VIIYVDIDGTICSEMFVRPKQRKHYEAATPFYERIARINELYDQGHEIHYWTARGATSKVDWRELTEQQLTNWGCKYHYLHVGNKPHFDMYICDKSFNSEAWFTQNLYEQNPQPETR